MALPGLEMRTAGPRGPAVGKAQAYSPLLPPRVSGPDARFIQLISSGVGLFAGAADGLATKVIDGPASESAARRVGVFLANMTVSVCATAGSSRRLRAPSRVSPPSSVTRLTR